MQGPDYLRIGDAERDKMTESLHEHFAQGRLTAEELDERLAATLTARTVGDLKAVDRDLPGQQPAIPQTPPPYRGRGFRPPFLLKFAFLALIITAIAGGGHDHGPPAVFHVIFIVALLAFIFRAVRFRRHVRRYGPPPWARGRADWQAHWDGRPNWHGR